MKEKKYLKYSRKQFTDKTSSYHSRYDAKQETIYKAYIEDTGIENVVTKIVTNMKNAGYSICSTDICLVFAKHIDDKNDVVQIVEISGNHVM